ncbi:hypothetical protein [Amycolatopsis lexingtonensis]|uniref:hypothetical protein n=1 Tax=Amycolatopsis lexingtonensis TaxID=218822 RepID=UPI003F6F96AA
MTTQRDDEAPSGLAVGAVTPDVLKSRLFGHREHRAGDQGRDSATPGTLASRGQATGIARAASEGRTAHPRQLTGPPSRLFSHREHRAGDHGRDA